MIWAVSKAFLDSHDPVIRRLSAAAYSIATAITAILLSGGLHHFQIASPVSAMGGALFVAGEALVLWWLAAGILLRVVRVIERRRNRAPDQAPKHLASNDAPLT
jgi:hypothetical protein